MHGIPCICWTASHRGRSATLDFMWRSLLALTLDLSSAHALVHVSQTLIGVKMYAGIILWCMACSVVISYVQEAFAAGRHVHSPLAVGGSSEGGRCQHMHAHGGGLHTLSVAGCPGVTAVGMLDLLKACSTSLTHINVSRTAVSSLQRVKWVRAAILSAIRAHSSFMSVRSFPWTRKWLALVTSESLPWSTLKACKECPSGRALL